MQAIVATAAIIAVYYATTIPVKAEARYRANERKLRAEIQPGTHVGSIRIISRNP